jgi:hypothetical protein
MQIIKKLVLISKFTLFLFCLSFTSLNAQESCIILDNAGAAASGTGYANNKQAATTYDAASGCYGSLSMYDSPEMVLCVEPTCCETENGIRYPLIIPPREADSTCAMTPDERRLCCLAAGSIEIAGGII